MGLILTVEPETAERRWRREDLRLPLGHTALYRMWDAIGGLLYVGITGNPVERWRRHAQKAEWWAAVSWITYETYPKEHLALEAERRAIRAERPAFNIRSAVALCLSGRSTSSLRCRSPTTRRCVRSPATEPTQA